MPHPSPIFEPVPGATSDHTRRSIQVTFERGIDQQGQPKPPLVVKAGTWNMQMFCRSKQSNGGHHSNNPTDTDETPDTAQGPGTYTQRKLKQIDQLEKMVTQGCDIIALQEPDWYYHKDEKNQYSLRKAYMDMLKKHGYDIVLSGQGVQPLITVYNAKKFKHDKSEGQIKGTVGKSPHRALESVFTDKATGQAFVIGNLHLEFGQDHRQRIADLQKGYQTSGHPTILLGDTNNVVNLTTDNALGDYFLPTNISMDNTTGKLTARHNVALPNGTFPNKIYDTFFVSGGGHDALITDTEGEYFSTDSSNNDISLVPIPPNRLRTHFLLAGHPWMPMKKHLQRVFDTFTKNSQDGVAYQEWHTLQAYINEGKIFKNQDKDNFDYCQKCYSDLLGQKKAATPAVGVKPVVGVAAPVAGPASKIDKAVKIPTFQEISNAQLSDKLNFYKSLLTTLTGKNHLKEYVQTYLPSLAKSDTILLEIKFIHALQELSEYKEKLENLSKKADSTKKPLIDQKVNILKTLLQEKPSEITAAQIHSLSSKRNTWDFFHKTPKSLQLATKMLSALGALEEALPPPVQTAAPQ
ncbi:MAG: hypothetical protein Q8R79_06755 [Legionellaceae bacterium]|nr:hypothetical protein [Legionellaceae bacterium]